MTLVGQRRELVEELRKTATGWAHFGNDRLSQEAEEATHQLEQGHTEVQVGHLKFKVTET